MQESPSGMAPASQAGSGGFDSRFLLQRGAPHFMGRASLAIKKKQNRRGATGFTALPAVRRNGFRFLLYKRMAPQWAPCVYNIEEKNEKRDGPCIFPHSEGLRGANKTA